MKFSVWFAAYYPDDSRLARAKRLSVAAQVSVTTIYSVLNGMKIRNAEKAKLLSAATDGAVSVGELLGL